MKKKLFFLSIGALFGDETKADLFLTDVFNLRSCPKDAKSHFEEIK